MNDRYLKTGIFLAPFHALTENPLLALDRDMELLIHLDRLNYHEAWIGEHHSAGFEIIAFRDINLEPQALAAHGASLEDVRRRLHATDEAGRLLVGADVAIAVWRVTPGERWLAALLGNPVVRPVTRLVYDRFADLLYAWNRRKGHW